MLANRIDGGLEEITGADAGDFDGILKRQENAFAAPAPRLTARIFAVVVTSPSVTSYVSRPASTWASVLLPEPFLPMMAWTSPGLMVRLTPLRISRSRPGVEVVTLERGDLSVSQKSRCH